MPRTNLKQSESLSVLYVPDNTANRDGHIPLKMNKHIIQISESEKRGPMNVTV